MLQRKRLRGLADPFGIEFAERFEIGYAGDDKRAVRMIGKACRKTVAYEQPPLPGLYHGGEAGHKRKGERHMMDAEKAVCAKLAEALEALPPEKKEYMIGYAEGVAAMKRRAMEEPDEEKSA